MLPTNTPRLGARSTGEVAAALPLLVDLDGSGAPVATVGGKAAAIDRLVALGLAVPSSHAVTTEAYRRFVAAEPVATLLAELRTEALPDPSHHRAERRRVDEVFATTPLPEDVAEALVGLAAAYPQGARLAVRSSATAEDLHTASFAGQYRSLLGVEPDELADAVRAVWASLWHPAPRSYRRFRAVDEAHLAMAALVMEMLDPALAGVAFTVDPAHPDSMRIEVVHGLGERLVSGAETPEVHLVPRDGPTDPANPRWLVELTSVARRIEDALGAPQDLEWALDDQGLHLLQTRPITTRSGPASTDDGFDVHVRAETYTTAGIAEMVPGVLPPLRWETNSWLLEDGLRDLFDELGADLDDLAPAHALIGRLRGRAALDLDRMREAAASIPGGSVAELDHQYFGDPSGVGDPAPTEPGRLTGVGQTVRTLRARVRAAERSETAVATIDRLVVAEPDPQDYDNAGVLALRARLLHLAGHTMSAEVIVAAIAAASYRGVETFLTQHVGPGAAARLTQELTAGTGAARRARIVRELEPLAARLRHDPVLGPLVRASDCDDARRLLADADGGPNVLDRFQTALRRAGCTSTFAGPTWEEHPAPAWATLRQTLDRPPPAPTRAHDHVLDEIHRELATLPRWRLARWVTGQIVDARGRFLRRESRDAAEFLDRRERTKEALARLGGIVRRVELEVGLRLVATGRLESPEDVEHLTGDELHLLLLEGDGPSLEEVAVRRRRLERARVDGPLPRIFVGEPQPVVAARTAGDHLTGWGASPGRYEGPARVITDLTQGGLRRGEVLVAHTTDAAWAPLFLTAGAIVVEEGGPLCHAAIVARELGVPAVVNVPGVVELVRAAGEVDLVVDGDTGDLVVHRAGDPDQSWGPGAMPSRRSPGTLDRTDTRLGIFVTGLIGAGAVFSAVVAATEAVGSVRGQRRLAAHAAPIADMYAAGVVEGFDTVARTPIGLRERRTFAALAVIAFALATLVGGHAIGEWDGRGDIGTVLAVTAQLAGAATVAWWGATVAQAWRQWPAVRPTLRRVLAARPVRRPDVVTTFGRRHWNVIVGLGTFFVILGLVNRFVPEPLQRIDDWLYDEVLDAGSANERWGPELFNWFGRPAFVIPFAFLIAVMTLRNRRLALAFPLAVTVGGLVNLTCAWLVPRLRPASGIHAGKSDSFPAGHPIMIVLLLGVLPLAVGALTRSTRAQRVARVVCTATLGLALIDTVRKGSHWPTDLLAGTMLGLLLTVAVHGYVRQGAHTSRVPP